MSQPDDIEKLLREIDAMNAGQGGGVPAKPEEKAVEPAKPAKPAESGSGSRLAWTGTSAVGGLLVGGFTGTVLTFLPYVGTASTALGAAFGAAVAAAVSGPPRWFNKG